MDTHTYPGKGLSLSQLVFALNEELRRTVYPPLYVGCLKIVEGRHANRPYSTTSDEVSQLERDISTALAAARELKNSFAPINRIPSDILSLIPTHINSQRGVFRASFVCRHWRRALLQHGALWSWLFVNKDEDYVTTLLERAKGSALDIVVNHHTPPEIITLLSLHGQKIRHLEFPHNCWKDISTFSQVNSGQLPLLRTLEICAIFENDDHDDQSDILTTPSLPLFSGSVNLEELHLNFTGDVVGDVGGLLDRFVFANLTTFSLSASPHELYDTSHLLDFLKASPTLRAVDVTIYGCMAPEEVPQHMSVVLPNIETFPLYAVDDFWRVYESAIHISCPRAKHTSLTDAVFDDEITYDSKIFPDSASWNTIVRQYSTSPVEEVTLKIHGGRPLITTKCSLTFRSSDTTVIKLGFEVPGKDEGGAALSREQINLTIFARACQVVGSHPLLSHIKRLRFKDETRLFDTKHRISMAHAVRGLFLSLGPLDELTVRGCDLQIFLLPFVNLGGFPHVKELTISKALIVDEEQCVGDIVKLAKLQHELQRPFERVTVSARGIPAAMAERLGQWVGAVDCHEP